LIRGSPGADGESGYGHAQRYEKDESPGESNAGLSGARLAPISGVDAPILGEDGQSAIKVAPSEFGSH
jgi:hypothetical protein